MNIKNKNIIVLTAVYISFLALGMPDGAFGVAWPGMRYELGLGLDRAFLLVVSHSVFYALAGSLMGRMAAFLKLPNVNILGLGLILLGMGGFAFSPNLYFLIIFTMVLGMGMGMVDSSLNAFAAKYFAARHMNWLHCFWGLGGSISPIIMSQMVILFGWRTGYVSIFALQGIMFTFVLITLLKGAWVMTSENSVKAEEEPAPEKFLTERRYPIIQVIIFMVYAAFEYAITFWTTSVMLEGRGLYIGVAGLYPAVYLGSMTAGRIVMGYASHRMSNTTMIRFGLALSIAGLGILTVSNNFIGMAMVGFGFGPVFPCLMHETGRRYSPEATTKLVGYQIAGVGVGVGLSTFGMGRLLEGISLNALFPAVIIGMTMVALLNEIIEFAMRRQGLYGAGK